MTGGDGVWPALSWEQLLTGPAGAGGVRAVSPRHVRAAVTTVGELGAPWGLPLDDGMGWGEAITWTAAAAGAALVAARCVGGLLH